MVQILSINRKRFAEQSDAVKKVSCRVACCVTGCIPTPAPCHALKRPSSSLFSARLSSPQIRRLEEKYAALRDKNLRLSALCSDLEETLA